MNTFGAKCPVLPYMYSHQHVCFAIVPPTARVLIRVLVSPAGSPPGRGPGPALLTRGAPGRLARALASAYCARVFSRLLIGSGRLHLSPAPDRGAAYQRGLVGEGMGGEGRGGEGRGGEGRGGEGRGGEKVQDILSQPFAPFEAGPSNPARSCSEHPQISHASTSPWRYWSPAREHH